MLRFIFHLLDKYFTGNEVIFSLETASHCIQNDKVAFWGFRCSVVDYDWLETNNVTGNRTSVPWRHVLSDPYEERPNVDKHIQVI